LLQAQELAPNNLEVVTAVAAAQQQKDELTQAAATLEQGLQQHPEAAILYEKLAALALQRQQPKEALRWLRQGLEHLPDSTSLQLTLADVLVQQNDTRQAAEVLKQLRQQADLVAVADLFQARLDAQQDNWPQALDLLERLRARPDALSLQGQAQLWQLLGDGYAQQGDYPQAWRFHQLATQASPDWVLPRFALGEDLLILGRAAEAAEQFRPLVETASAPPTAPILYVQAILLAQRTQPRAEPDWVRLTELLDRAEQKNPDSVQIPLLRAEILTECGQAGSARKLLEQVRQQKPKEVRFVVALADLARREKKLDQACQYLEEAEQRWPGALEVQLGWLRYWTARGGSAALTALRDMLPRSVTLPPAQRWNLLRQLAPALALQGDQAAAGQCWLQVANHYPRDLQSRFQLLELALNQRDEAAAQRWLTELHQLEGADGLWWRYGEAARIVLLANSPGSTDLRQAQDYLSELKKAQPGWGRVWLLSGLLEERLGQEKQAIQSYLAALGQGELPPPLMVRLAQVLFDRQRFLEADLVVRHLEEKGPLPHDMARLAAELALIHKDLTRAAQLARAAVPPETHDYRARLWLAHVLNQTGATSEAETLLRQLLPQAAHVPEVWVRLIEQLLQNGKSAEAQALLKDIPQQVPPPQQTVTLARCYEALGELARAEQTLLQQTRQQSTDFRTWKSLAEFYLRQRQYAQAEPWLRKLIAPANELPPQLVQRAQRQLAVALAKQGPAHGAEALALLQIAPGQRTPDREDREALAFVLATQPEHYAQAIQMLEQLRTDPDHAPEEEFTLADLYLQTGEPEKAGKLLLWLINLDREHPDYLAAYVTCLLALQDLDGAEYYLHRLQQLQPDQPRTRELRQRVQAARTQFAPPTAAP
jgi:predicted Zn-dependent protease